jgi:hypothetical protein
MKPGFGQRYDFDTVVHYLHSDGISNHKVTAIDIQCNPGHKGRIN